MNFATLSPEEKRKRVIAHANHEIVAWRKFYATTKDPLQKLFAEIQINYHLKAINN